MAPLCFAAPSAATLFVVVFFVVVFFVVQVAFRHRTDDRPTREGHDRRNQVRGSARHRKDVIPEAEPQTTIKIARIEKPTQLLNGTHPCEERWS